MSERGVYDPAVDWKLVCKHNAEQLCDVCVAVRAEVLKWLELLGGTENFDYYKGIAHTLSDIGREGAIAGSDLAKQCTEAQARNGGLLVEAAKARAERDEAVEKLTIQAQVQAEELASVEAKLIEAEKDRAAFLERQRRAIDMAREQGRLDFFNVLTGNGVHVPKTEHDTLLVKLAESQTREAALRAALEEIKDSAGILTAQEHREISSAALAAVSRGER